MLIEVRASLGTVLFLIVLVLPAPVQLLTAASLRRPSPCLACLGIVTHGAWCVRACDTFR
jgi:hypothetical protein